MISGSALVEIAPIATKFSCPGLTTKPCFIISDGDVDNHDVGDDNHDAGLTILVIIIASPMMSNDEIVSNLFKEGREHGLSLILIIITIFVQ